MNSTAKSWPIDQLTFTGMNSVLRIRDPVLFYLLDPGCGSGMNFFRIPDPRGMFFGESFIRILVLKFFFTNKTCS
jgi:hypothetical protein